MMKSITRFFFQAEDGIRDWSVTGVQTCALPILGKAKFNLDYHLYELEPNDGENTNHGGYDGFNSNVFEYVVTPKGITFNLLSKDGDGGFPGNLQFSVDRKSVV